MKKLIFPVLCLLILSGCSIFRPSWGKPSTPDWVRNPSQLQGGDSLIVRVAEASSRTEAEKEATNKVISVFRGRIAGDADQKINRAIAILNGFVLDESHQEELEALRAQQDAELHQIRFVRYWTPSRRKVYAVAQLERNTASLAYRDKIEALEDRVLELLSKAVPIRDRWGRYALLHAASLIDIYHEQLGLELAVIDPDAKSAMRPAYDPEVLARQLSDYAAQLKVQPITEADSLSEGLYSTQPLLQSFGFGLESGAEFTLRLQLDGSIENAKKATVYHFDYQFSFVFGANDTVFARSGRLSYSEKKDAPLGTASKVRLAGDLDAILREAIIHSLERTSLEI